MTLLLLVVYNLCFMFFDKKNLKSGIICFITDRISQNTTTKSKLLQALLMSPFLFVSHLKPNQRLKHRGKISYQILGQAYELLADFPNSTSLLDIASFLRQLILK